MDRSTVPGGNDKRQLVTDIERLQHADVKLSVTLSKCGGASSPIEAICVTSGHSSAAKAGIFSLRVGLVKAF